MVLRIVYGGEERLVTLCEKTRIYDVIIKSGIPFDAQCGGHGRCLKCLVKAFGNLSEKTEKEKDLKEGERLACESFILGDATIIIDNKDEIKEEKSLKEFITVTDLGTTTIEVKAFYDNGTEAFGYSFKNPLISYGADVITRAEAFPKGTSDAEKILKNTIENEEKAHGMKAKKRYFVGNTVMLHFLTGKDVNGFGTYPFEVESLFGFEDEFGYYFGCASAFIGADVIAAAMSKGIGEGGSALIVDVGTNTEMILFDGKKFYACSAPAGPAFEGSEIKYGKRAENGAIYDVFFEDGGIKCKTVGNEKPTGICGSGLLAFCHALYKGGYVSFDGTPIKEFPSFGGITVTPEDAAKFLTAKAAIRSGIDTLLNAAGIEKADKFYIAGNFGSGLDLKKAFETGMFPSALEDKAKTVGNAALKGACLAAFDKEKAALFKKIAKETEAIELANDGFFAENFIKNIRFI